ncbi:hypothetical protein IWX76_001522 [Pedobacter sp. CAN_A7]|uniref:DUF3472 domain-containing protein n=1 Tax=Pedobacter sp. CAN_A7 TaxID=2787722 RepID=UPI001A2089C9
MNKHSNLRKLLCMSAGAIIIAFAGMGFNFKSVNKTIELTTIEVPVAGNTWKTNNEELGGTITDDGIVNWTDQHAEFKTYIRSAKPGRLEVWIKLSVPQGKSQIEVAGPGRSVKINVEGNSVKAYSTGTWLITDTGYLNFKIKGLSRTGSKFADVSSFQIRGTNVDDITFVKNNEGNFYHWGRRGPSVHLNYILPEDLQAEWFYNEVKVPVRNDVIGSYFMANGFGEGYFGMQVNSATERRILFSVWSPFTTDDPDKIPETQKIRLLAKGKDVHVGEFGNEGSGGQSYLKYNWKAGVNYKFLLHGRPEGENHSIYTAYFYDPEKESWMLIASFSRPDTRTYLKRLHSFLENFVPDQGHVERQVEFTNQWVRSSAGKWIELHKARFTGDNTARKKYRMDYGGGIHQNSFYLRNCGFFNDYTELGQVFERPLSGQAPEVKFDDLPN